MCAQNALSEVVVRGLTALHVSIATASITALAAPAHAVYLHITALHLHMLSIYNCTAPACVVHLADL